GVDALDDRDVLVEARAALVAQEAVDLDRAAGVRGVQRRERVVLDAVLAQEVEPAHDPVEAALAALVDAERVVQLTRAVDRDADEEAVLGEDLRPLVVD